MGPRERAAAIARDSAKRKPRAAAAAAPAAAGGGGGIQVPANGEGAHDSAAAHASSAVGSPGRAREGEALGHWAGVSLLVVGGFHDSRHLRDTEVLRLPHDLASMLYSLDDLWQQQEEAQIGFEGIGEGEGGETRDGGGAARGAVDAVPGPSMAFKRSGVAVAVLGGATSAVQGVYSFGGFDGAQPVRTVEVLGLGVGAKGAGAWREVHMMKQARYAAAALELPRADGAADVAAPGRIGVFGGFDGQLDGGAVNASTSSSCSVRKLLSMPCRPHGIVSPVRKSRTTRHALRAQAGSCVQAIRVVTVVAVAGERILSAAAVYTPEGDAASSVSQTSAAWRIRL